MAEPDAAPRAPGERDQPPPADHQPLKALRINLAPWDEEEPPDQEWGVYNRFPARQTGLLSGEGAIGKSSTLLHLCAAYTLKHVDWLGAVLDNGPAIFIDCDDEVKVMWRRLAPVAKHYKVRFANFIAGGLELISLVGHDPVLAVASRSGKIETTRRYAELLEMAGDLKPKCIAIASSANVFAGSEIDRSQVQQFTGHLTRVARLANGIVVLAQHPANFLWVQPPLQSCSKIWTLAIEWPFPRRADLQDEAVLRVTFFTIRFFIFFVLASSLGSLLG